MVPTLRTFALSSIRNAHIYGRYSATGNNTHAGPCSRDRHALHQKIKIINNPYLTLKSKLLEMKK
jgi:hypothetical protein